MNIELINIWYVIAAALFIFGLKQLGSPATAVRGNMLSSLGMLIAVVVTLFNVQIISFQWIAIAALGGAIIGAVVAQKIEMTSMPEMVALFNGSGGIASLLVGWAALYSGQTTTFTDITILLSVVIGGITFSGSILAWGKLSEVMNSAAIVFGAQRFVNALILVALLACAVMFCQDPSVDSPYLYAVIGLSLVFGVMAVLPIGGADMPVVISLLNSYSGLAACAAGFAINNNILIVAGSMVGAAGIILTNIMCKAMNRSLMNVLLSGFAKPVEAGEKIEGEIKVLSAQDAFYVLEAAQAVLVVPGYGMAVAQAQHAVRELQSLLEENGCTVDYAIHAVAGRMPGHMNVLLAEADVPYDQLYEMDDVNPRMENYDVVIVIGANDVVNPAAKEMKGSPIYGMPVIEAHRAKTVFVLKRSANAGFAGVDNPLFFKDNTRMVLGDAKDTINSIIREFGDD